VVLKGMAAGVLALSAYCLIIEAYRYLPIICRSRWFPRCAR
jgi:hypothetical protein